ncbi:MAG: hypothetical protein COA52_17890 [Hyphomicrobiales bacterium]|nr:MAG: hypothetical protein COA52_17890 [Hyphomicrobiales bacterium]
MGGYDFFAHFLASRGYAVLQPNFRGSSGYGYQWRQAGFGEWGTGIMQHDLTDVAQNLIERGFADPDRICIVGASYGGYAALAAAAFTPDQFTCAIAIAPVTDISMHIRYLTDRTGRSHSAITRFQEMITETAWGHVWSGSNVSDRERSMMTIALLAGLGHEEELAMHIRSTANTGASMDDVREALMHVAIYAGVPAANTAFRIAKQTYAKMESNS